MRRARMPIHTCTYNFASNELLSITNNTNLIQKNMMKNFTKLMLTAILLVAGMGGGKF